MASRLKEWPLLATFTAVLAAFLMVLIEEAHAQSSTGGVSTIIIKCRDPKNDSTCYVVQIPLVKEDKGYIAKAVFLALIFLIAFVLNMILLVSVATSMDLKRHHHNHIIMHMTVPNLVECICNVSVAISYVASEPWAMGKTMCNVNAFFTYLVLVVQSGFVLLLAFDRYLALKTFLWYKKAMTLARANLICFVIWLVSVGSVIVLAPGVISNSPFPTRYSCAPLDQSQLGFEVFMWILVVVVCNIGAAVLFLALACIIRSELADDTRPWVQARKRTNAQSASSRTIFRTPKLSREADATKVSIAVAVAFLILWVPHILDIRVEQTAMKFYANYTDGRGGRPGGATLGISGGAEPAASGDNSTTNPNVLPEVLNGTVISTVLIWLRFLFAVAYPLLVLIFNPQIKLKFDSIICCLSPTSIYGESRIMSALAHKQKTSYRVPASSNTENSNGLNDSSTNPKANTKRSKDIVSYKTPILFATLDGLHLRTLDASSIQKPPKQKSWLDLNVSAGSRAVWGQSDPTFIAEMCDQYIIDDTLAPAGVESKANSAGSEKDVELDGLSIHTVDSAEKWRNARPSSYVEGGDMGGMVPPGRLSSPDRSLIDDAGTDVTDAGDSDEEVDSGHSSSVPSTATSSASNTEELEPPDPEFPAMTRVLALPKAPPTGRVPLPPAPNKGQLRRSNSEGGEKKLVRFSNVIEEIPGAVVTYDVISGHAYDEGEGEDDNEDPWSAGGSDKASLTPTDFKQKPQIKKSNDAPNPGSKRAEPRRAGKTSSVSSSTRQAIERGSTKVAETISLGAARRNNPQKNKISAKVDSRPRKIPVQPRNGPN